MKTIYEYKGILFDSREEVNFAKWCQQLLEAGYIERWEKNTKSIEICSKVEFPYVKETLLKTKTKREPKNFTFLQNLSYTWDFTIDWSPKGFEKFVSYIGFFINPKSIFFGSPNTTYVEIKPGFNFNGKNDRFSLIQKVLWYIKDMFVDFIVCEDLFRETFLPKECEEDFKYKKSPSGKNKGMKGIGDWKMDWKPKTLSEFLNIN